MRRGTVLLALVCILVGTYSLLVQLDIGIPSWDILWPVLPFSGGAALLIGYLRSDRQDQGRVFWGTALTLSGLFFFLVTLNGADYTMLETWWPIFVCIGGISFLALWIAQGLRDTSSLFLAVVALIFGGVALAIQLGFLTTEVAYELTNLWPAFLILAGLLLLLRGIFGGKKKAE